MGLFAEQGQEARAANINGVIKLEQFIELKVIDAVWIDSAKSVASRGGWSYIDNVLCEFFFLT